METLKSSRQFDRVRREGRTWASSLMVLNAAPNAEGTVRYGFIAGKKVGGAVQRNRARRLIREALRPQQPFLKTGWDLVWIARAPIVESKLDIVKAEIEQLLARSRLFANPHETGAAQSRIIEQKGAEIATSQAATPRAAAQGTPVAPQTPSDDVSGAAKGPKIAKSSKE